MEGKEQRVIKIAQKKGFDLLKEKVPEFRSPFKMILIITIGLLIFLGIMIFFWWFDGLVWYGVIISQSIVALICSVLLYGYTKKANKYRKKYENLAYRYFFFHFVILILITGNACIFHVLFVEGPPLLPFWFAIIFGIFLIFMRFFLEWHLRRSGFDEIGHGLGIYMVFPEEGERINSEIYSFIRHPMYAGDICLALGFALLKNNLLAIFMALISFVPFIIAARLEDNELIKRYGEMHRLYVKETGAIFPHLRDLGKLIRFLFSKRRKI